MEAIETNTRRIDGLIPRFQKKFPRYAGFDCPSNNRSIPLQGAAALAAFLRLATPFHSFVLFFSFFPYFFIGSQVLVGFQTI